MADKPKRRSPWPRPTLHTIFFAVGCTIGWLETMADEQGLNDAQIDDLRERLEHATLWPQRQALEKLWPLMHEVGQMCQLLGTTWSGGFNPETARQVEDQLSRFLPPDVQF
jgi:hypothetical protein